MSGKAGDRPSGQGTTWSAALVLLGGLLAGGAVRADIVCRAEVNRNEVPAGQDVVLTVSVEGGGGWSAEFTLPDLPGVGVYAGGTNQSISMINGRTQASVTRTYYLRPEVARNFTIGPIAISAGGQTCRTEPIDIKVLPATSGGGIPPVDSGNRQQAPPQVGSRSATTPASAGSDMFVSLDAETQQAWVGQQIVLRFRYWRRTQPWSNPTYVQPRTEGFWREDLGTERNYRENVGGRIYNVTELRYALFPTHAGRLVVEPAQLVFAEDVFERFFSSRVRPQEPRVLRTDSLVIVVKDLPEPRPAGFSGIVASRLDLTVEAARDSVLRGEAVGLQIKLETDGFLKGFAGLTVPEPPRTKLHDASENLEVKIAHDRLLGAYTAEKVVLPQKPGPLTIAPLEVSWFDTGRGAYRVARTEPVVLRVAPSDLPQAGDESSGFMRSELARLSQDLAFIHPPAGRLSRRAVPLVNRAAWWAALMAPLVLLAAWRALVARVVNDRRDPVGLRRRRALRAALQRLHLAEREPDASRRLGLYAAAVQGFVADTRGLPAAAVQGAEVADFATDLGLPEAGVRLKEILAACDAGRFGGAAGVQDERLGKEIGRLVRQLNGRVSRRAGTAAGQNSRLLSCLLLVLGTGCGLPSLAQTPATPDAQRLLAQGNQAYTDGQIDEALASYLAARDLGVDDPVLHYNLGNTYARRGELGRAVASYLRAQRLAPRDRDIAANLAWVRQHLQDLELASHQYPLLVRPLVALVKGLTLNQWSWLLAGLVWLVALLVGSGWYREYFGPWLRRSLLLAAAVATVVAAIVAWRWYDERVRNTAVVVVEEAKVRSGPADSFPVLFEVHDGLTLTVTGERQDWVRIGLGGDWQGWLPAASIESVRLP